MKRPTYEILRSLDGDGLRVIATTKVLADAESIVRKLDTCDPMYSYTYRVKGAK